MLCFGGDPAYRKYVLTVERRKGAAMRGRWQSSLRLLMTALAVYMQVRGSKVTWIPSNAGMSEGFGGLGETNGTFRLPKIKEGVFL